MHSALSFRFIIFYRSLQYLVSSCHIFLFQNLKNSLHSDPLIHRHLVFFFMFNTIMCDIFVFSLRSFEWFLGVLLKRIVFLVFGFYVSFDIYWIDTIQIKYQCKCFNSLFIYQFFLLLMLRIVSLTFYAFFVSLVDCFCIFAFYYVQNVLLKNFLLKNQE